MNNFEKNTDFHEENQGNNIESSKTKKIKTKSPKRNVGFFEYVADWFAKGLKSGFFGFVFTELYDLLNNKWRSGSIYQFFHRNKNKVRAHSGIGNLYETSLTRMLILWLGRFVIQTKMRVFAVALFSFAFSTICMAFLKNVIPLDNVQAVSSNISIYFSIPQDVLAGIIIGAFSIPFAISRKRVGEALLEGKISGYIIHHILSMDETQLEADETTSGGNSMVAFELAMLLGFTTYIIDPLIILTVIFLIIAFAIIMCFPELGIMSVMIIMPFANVFENPSLVILILILFTLISYISKFIRGKRIMRFELIDMAVLVFGAITLLGGIFAYGGSPSFFRALLYCGFLTMYFLIVNSYIRKPWIYRGIKLIIITTAIIAILGVLDGGTINPSIIDLSQFSSFGARVNAFFGNPNMLGAYMVIVFPFSIAQMANARNKLGRAVYAVSLISILVCIILTGSRGAWLGWIVALAMFFVVFDFKNIWFVLVGLVYLPTLLYIIPSVRERFMSILNVIFDLSNTDTSIAYRIKTWEALKPMVLKYFWTGIGVGESAFAEVYSKYAISGTENVMHSHNMFLQILLELGIIGLLVFTVIIFMYSQKCFTSIKNSPKGSHSRLMISAGYASMCGALIMGLTDHIFYNYRVFLIFWMFMGLTVALTKINERERLKEREALRVNSNGRSADLDIYTDKKIRR